MIKFGNTLVIFLVLTFATTHIQGQEKLTGKDLLASAKKGDLAGVKKALDDGVDVNSATEYGATALTYASDRGNLDIAKLLVEKGADVNKKDTFYGSTAITWAAYGGHTKIIKLLLDNGSKGADQVLFTAVSSGNKEMAKVVIDSGKASKSSIARAKMMLASNPKEDFKELFDKLEAGDEKTEYKAEPEQLKKLAGNFESASGVKVTFKFEDGKLLAGNTGGSRFLPLTPVAENQFELGIVKVSFILRGEEVRAIRWVADGSNITLRPVAKSAPKTKTDVPEAKSEYPESSAESKAADLAISSPNWPQIRGNGARGVGEGQNPPVEFDAETGKNLLWKTPIGGLANSSPAVWGDRLFLTTAISDADQAGLRTGNYGDVKSVDDNSEHSFEVFCLNKKTGEIIWKRQAIKAKPKVKRHLKSTHANPTPATDGKHVVAFFGSEGLYCYSVDGELLWKKDLGTLDSGWFYDSGYQWGFGASPIIYKGNVIVQCDIQENSFIAAYDLKSGSEIWRTDRKEIPSWSTPTIVSTKDGDILVTNATKAARAYNPENGKELWSLEGHSEIVVPTPFMAHGLIFLCSGYSPIQPIYAIKPTAKGDITLPKGESKSEAIEWSQKRGGPYMPTPICYGDYLYVCSNSGILTCIQATTGKRVYRKRISSPTSASFVGSPVAADGHIYFPGETGYVIVVKAGPNYEKVANNKVGENILSIPAISEGVIYVRAQKHIFAFGKKD